MQKKCKQCTVNFNIDEADLSFYNKVSPIFAGEKYFLPPPTLCADCRMQRRMAWRNELKLYHRLCDFSKKPIISVYSSDKPYKIYDREIWWSDQWDPLEYGQDFDFNRPFFEQLNELFSAVPKQALHQNNNENCAFTTSTSWCKNCYLIASSPRNEDCYYGLYLNKNKDCIDTLGMTECEGCYDCIDCKNCYNIANSQASKNCFDCRFVHDCRNCSNCFFCYGLRNKNYCINNIQYSKEDYFEKLKNIDFSSHKKIEQLKIEFKTFCQTKPHIYFDGTNNENVDAGDHIYNCKNCSRCFDVSNLEDCKFCIWFHDSKDSYDIYSFGLNSELIYECLEVGDLANRVLFSISCWNNISDLLYCLACHSSQYLFGCVGLKRKKYCIFNKQYSKEEYEKLVPKIIEHMKKRDEWGEFFPMKYSHFAYNESIAYSHYPMKKDDIVNKGLKWKDQTDEIPKTEKIIPAQKLPDRTSEISDEIVQWAIECEATGRPFRILAQELKFYRRHELPLPHFHPDERHRRRLENRNPRKLWQRKCAKCSKELQTSYAPERPEIVYCEECYLKEVY